MSREQKRVVWLRIRLGLKLGTRQLEPSSAGRLKRKLRSLSSFLVALIVLEEKCFSREENMYSAVRAFRMHSGNFLRFGFMF